MDVRWPASSESKYIFRETIVSPGSLDQLASIERITTRGFQAEAFPIAPLVREVDLACLHNNCPFDHDDVWVLLPQLLSGSSAKLLGTLAIVANDTVESSHAVIAIGS